MSLPISKRPPVIKLDSEAGAVYLRFKTTRVVKTIERKSRTHMVTVDVDRLGDVIGIEAVGGKDFSISSLGAILRDAGCRGAILASLKNAPIRGGRA